MNGLDRLDPQTGSFTHFQHDSAKLESLSNDTVRAILQDRDGTLWIGTHGGLDRYDPNTNGFQHYRHEPENANSLSCNRVRTLYEDKAGTLWIGTGSVWKTKAGIQTKAA